jgi:uncharacterized protein YecT (DUF1311 family)
VIALLVPLLLAGALPAADRQLNACLAKAVNDPEFSACSGAALDRADARLNARWRILMDIMKSDYNADDRSKTIEEERSWVAYKEKACQVYWDQLSFGSLHRTIEGPACILQVMNERIADINTMIGVIDPEDGPRK